MATRTNSENNDEGDTERGPGGETPRAVLLCEESLQAVIEGVTRNLRKSPSSAHGGIPRVTDPPAPSSSKTADPSAISPGTSSKKDGK